jgi:hypothetical protein
MPDEQTGSTSSSGVPNSHDNAENDSMPDVGQSYTPWTIEVAFFAVSGGFAVDTTTFWNKAQLTFTPAGILQLAKVGALPSPSVDSVVDKSKADTVAKMLVCIQAAWFMLQCIARLCQKLPLTLLEIHVLTHILCAFAMYFLWLKKPYDAASPLLCEDENAKDLAALFVLDTSKRVRYIMRQP